MTNFGKGGLNKDKQVINISEPGVRRDERPMLGKFTRCICSMETPQEFGRTV